MDNKTDQREIMKLKQIVEILTQTLNDEGDGDVWLLIEDQPVPDAKCSGVRWDDEQHMLYLLGCGVESEEPRP